MSKQWITAFSCLVLLAWPVVAQAGTEEAYVPRDKVPWSGYWWPHKQGLLQGPLAKYDKYYNARSQAWEQENHPKGVGADWHGYCHAWSASAVLESEPRMARMLKLPGGGPLRLTVGDQKGLLAAAHAQDVANMYGERSETTNVSAHEYQDLLPDQLWRILKNYVKQGKPVIMDLDAGPQVWNYPVYGYKVEYNSTGGNQYRGFITLWYAEDDVPPSSVGTKVGVRRYQFSCRMRGGSIVPGSAQWVGSSYKDHPDFAWSPYLVKPQNPQIDHKKVVALVKGGKVDDEEPKKEKDKTKDKKKDKKKDKNEKDRPPPPPDKPNLISDLLSPTDLLAVLARQASDWPFSVHTDRFNGRYEVGDKIKVRVLSEKAGYLYLLHITKEHRIGSDGKNYLEDKISLLYPASGDDNRIRGDAKRDGPFEVGIEAERPYGLQHIRAVVTSSPIRFTGLCWAKKKGEKREFCLNPTTKKMIVEGLDEVKVIMEKKGKTKQQRQDEVAEFVSKHTGPLLGDAKASKAIGKFAQSEATFYVGPAGKGKGDQK